MPKPGRRKLGRPPTGRISVHVFLDKKLDEELSKVASREGIHRSVIVNSSFVEEIKPYPTGEYGLRVKGGKEYTVTRTYKENLKSLAEFWIGAGAFFPNREQ